LATILPEMARRVLYTNLGLELKPTRELEIAVKCNYVLSGKYPIPSFLVLLIASWAIFYPFTLFGLVLGVFWGQPDHNLLDVPLQDSSLFLCVWESTRAIGAMLLWLRCGSIGRVSRVVRWQPRWLVSGPSFSACTTVIDLHLLCLEERCHKGCS